MTNDFISKATEFSRDFELAYNECNVEFLQKTNDVFLKSEWEETNEAIADLSYRYAYGAMEETLDGFADQAFLALNGVYKTLRMLGYKHDAATNLVGVVMNRVCDANLSKRNADGTITYKDGKVQKPSTFKAPEYDDIIVLEGSFGGIC